MSHQTQPRQSVGYHSRVECLCYKPLAAITMPSYCLQTAQDDFGGGGGGGQPPEPPPPPPPRSAPAVQVNKKIKNPMPEAEKGNFPHRQSAETTFPQFAEADHRKLQAHDLRKLDQGNPRSASQRTLHMRKCISRGYCAIVINGAVHSRDKYMYTEEESADSFCESDSGKNDCQPRFQLSA